MPALQPIIGFLNSALTVLRPTVFAAAALTAVGAVSSWAVRTRRIGPFTSFARLTRKSIDPMFMPVERRVVRFGGMPSQAPWWTVAVVVVAGLLILQVVQFVHDQLMMLAANSMGGPSKVALLFVSWVFTFLQYALIARVISSWVGGSPHSKWWRWSYRSTDWMLTPLRRVLPTFGVVDLSPMVAYFALMLLQNLINSSI
ncbi:MAG: YggT family protein [Gemmatimonadaceae bacterium]